MRSQRPIPDDPAPQKTKAEPQANANGTAFVHKGPAGKLQALPQLADSLLRNRTAELHRLMRNFFTARPQSNRGQDGRNHDSALHVFIS
jgi:hypothetical protein